MRLIIDYIKEYYYEVNKPVLAFCTIFIAILTWLNYQYGLEYRLINKAGLPFPVFFGHFLIYLVAFFIPHLFLLLVRKEKYSPGTGFWICLFTAPAIFAIKVSMSTSLNMSADRQWNSYW